MWTCRIVSLLFFQILDFLIHIPGAYGWKSQEIKSLHQTNSRGFSQPYLVSAQRQWGGTWRDVLDLNQRQMQAAGAGGFTGVLEEGAFSLSQGRTLEHGVRFRAGFKLAHLPTDISLYSLLELQTYGQGFYSLSTCSPCFLLGNTMMYDLRDWLAQCSF